MSKWIRTTKPQRSLLPKLFSLFCICWLSSAPEPPCNKRSTNQILRFLRGQVSSCMHALLGWLAFVRSNNPPRRAQKRMKRGKHQSTRHRKNARATARYRSAPHCAKTTFVTTVLDYEIRSTSSRSLASGSEQMTADDKGICLPLRGAVIL